MLTLIAIMLVLIFLAVIGKNGRRWTFVIVGGLVIIGKASDFFEHASPMTLHQSQTLLMLAAALGLLLCFISLVAIFRE